MISDNKYFIELLTPRIGNDDALKEGMNRFAKR